MNSLIGRRDDLQEAGTVLHLARSGRLIIKASSQVPDGTLLVDSQGRRTGRVIESIGPVAMPYLSVQPMTDRVERIEAAKLYVSEKYEHEAPRFKGRRNTKFPAKRRGNRPKRH